METWIKNAFQRLQTCSDLVELKDILIAFRTKLGFSYFIYGVQLPSAFTAIRHFIISDYPEEWLEEYLARNYYQIDPVVSHCTRFHEPYCWDKMHQETEPAIVAFAAAAASRGLVGGISIGIHGHGGDNGIFSLAGERSIETGSDEAFEIILYLNALLPYIHASVTRLTSYREAEASRPHLSDREIECLLWTAEGKTTEEIALILGISSATVAFHLKNVIQKLGVTNRNQAIAKAALLGIITPRYSTLSAPRTYLF